MTDTERNKFGKVAEAYSRFRRDYPSFVYEKIFEFLPNPGSMVLDVGCGTGIATLNLAKKYEKVIGIDKEKEMIDAAKLNNGDNIDFEVGLAERMSFRPRTFGLITCASAFHWFEHGQALREFKRVLKPKGKICIFWKMNNSPMLLEDFAWKNVQKYIPKYRNYLGVNHLNPSILLYAGFKGIYSEYFPLLEKYSVEDYLGYLRSHSTFSLVPENKKDLYLRDNKKDLESKLVGGKYIFEGYIEMWFAQI